MSTLQETLKHRRVGESALVVSGCHTAEAAVPALLIYATDDEQLVLPWSHFVCARHRDDGESERLVLFFANYEVEILGKRLTTLMPAIAQFHLNSLRSLPAKYEPQSIGSEPFIVNLSVRSMAPPPPSGIASSG
jgi:hypothetical protein